MNLTEREKWLMQQAWNVAKDLMPSDYFDIERWVSADTGLDGGDIEMLLAHSAPKPESIVKTVDADNLPDCEVWAWCDEGLYLGKINFHKTLDRLVIDNYFETLDGPTHYIEQKDLIKMISGVES